MPPRRPLAVLAALAVGLGLVAAPSAATAAPDQEMPFGCSEVWTGSTRSAHSPSPAAIDFNRPDDLGDLVVASASGVVSRVEDLGERSYGKWVRIDHGSGYSTTYAHLQAQWVTLGQFVDQGIPIGRVGDSGAVSGAHLHYEQRSGSSVVTAYFHGQRFVYGQPTASSNCPDVPLAGDWDGNRVDDLAVFRRTARRGTFELRRPDGTVARIQLGFPSDQPLVGDWDGDGVSDLGVRRQAVRDFLLRAPDGTVTRKRFGQVTDVAVTGDWDGDGVTDLGTWQPAFRRFRLLNRDGTVTLARLGSAGAIPVTGDWDRDGRTDLGVFERTSASFLLRQVSREGAVSVTTVPLGTGADLPVTGDWDGDGATDLGVWSPGTAAFTLRTTPAGQQQVRTMAFGQPR